jgi:hypothetical protein
MKTYLKKNIFMHPDIMLVDSIVGEFYRSSQANSIEEAREHKSNRSSDLFYGYSSIMDGLFAMSQIADMMDHNSQNHDIRIIITINDKVILPECYLGEAATKIDKWVEENTK